MFVGVLGSENPMSRSFYDDSWKKSYELESNSKMVAEMNWTEIVKERENEDIVIRIRLKNREHVSDHGSEHELELECEPQTEPEPELEMVQPRTYAPSTQLAPPVVPPSFSRTPTHSQVSPGQQNGVQSDGSALPSTTYGQPGNQLVHKHGLNPYLYSCPAPYRPEPLSPQLSFSYPLSAYSQFPYGNAYPHSAPYRYSSADTPSANPLEALTRVTPFRHTAPYSHPRGDSHYTPTLGGTETPTNQRVQSAPAHLAGR
jgi:hypothetical protein